MTYTQQFSPSLIRPLTADEEASYKKNGFLIYKSEAVRAYRNDVIEDVRKISLRLIAHLGHSEKTVHELDALPFDDLVLWCQKHDDEQRITRAFYEMYPTMPDVISKISHPLLLWLAKAVGITTPAAVTVPAIRVDRPFVKKFMTLPHQDYWYSMVCDNSVVIWCALTKIIREMGYLGAVPGSHTNGILPFMTSDQGATFSLKNDYPPEKYIDVILEDDEILIFNQYLVHKSGYNEGDRPRITMQVRYNDLETMDELVQTFEGVTSKYVTKRQNEYLSK